MKNFVIKSILLFLVVYFTWYIYITLCPNYYNSANNTRWRFIIQASQQKIFNDSSRVLFLGDSRLNAAINIHLFRSAISLSGGGASPIEMYVLLQNYLNNYPAPDTIILSVSPRFLSETFAFWTYAVRNGLCNQHEFNKIIANSDSLNDLLLDTFPKIRYLAHKLAWIPYFQTDVKRAYIFGRKNENTKIYNQMILSRGQYIHLGLKDSCNELNYEALQYRHFKPAPLLNMYLNKIFELCYQQDIFVYFCTMPMNESSVKNLSDSFINEYEIYMNAYNQKYPNFTIESTITSFPNIYFGDNSHLNKNGKTIFSEQLLQKLKHQTLLRKD